jgi:hypothetical protein
MRVMKLGRALEILAGCRPMDQGEMDWEFLVLAIGAGLVLLITTKVIFFR